MSEPAVYWEARARRYASEGQGLAAICSYGMPGFYNRAIDACQRLALRPWLRVPPGTRVLDVGCGVGRWSLELAGRGARVTGIDLSPTMIALAQLYAGLQGLATRCRFRVQDLATLEVAGRFDLVLGVTVLQHILEPRALRAAVERLVAHLARDGTLVLLEAAPDGSLGSCDSVVFQARQRSVYLQLFSECGLRLRAISGVDPAPFRIWLLPRLPRLPRWARAPALALITAASLPIDLLFGRRALRQSWHAVFILEHAREGGS